MGLLFFIFWVILNGRITAEIVVFGIFISFFVYLFSYFFLDYNPRYELKLLTKIPFIIMYIFVLIREIFMATITMIGFIFNYRDIPEPVIVHFDSPVKSEFARYVLAASITLTPGTIVVRLRDGEYQVHCYDIEMCRDIDDSPFVRILKKIEEGLL